MASRSTRKAKARQVIMTSVYEHRDKGRTRFKRRKQKNRNCQIRG